LDGVAAVKVEERVRFCIDFEDRAKRLVYCFECRI
jgi:hypothetical protein